MNLRAKQLGVGIVSIVTMNQNENPPVFNHLLPWCKQVAKPKKLLALPTSIFHHGTMPGPGSTNFQVTSDGQWERPEVRTKTRKLLDVE